MILAEARVEAGEGAVGLVVGAGTVGAAVAQVGGGKTGACGAAERGWRAGCRWRAVGLVGEVPRAAVGRAVAAPGGGQTAARARARKHGGRAGRALAGSRRLVRAVRAICRHSTCYSLTLTSK